MIKKTVNYIDFNGEAQTEDFYFNLTKAELARLQLTAIGGDFAETLQAIIDTKDGELIISKFEQIIAMSYGIRSEDGKRFMKSHHIVEEFKASAAYSEIFMELVTDAVASATFIRGLVPADLAAGMDDGAMKEATKMSEERIQGLKSMQGFKKKEIPTVDVSVQVVPELPTAAPVLEPEPVAIQIFDGKSDAEILAMVRKQNASQNFQQ